jgi:hypothetical protein
MSHAWWMHVLFWSLAVGPCALAIAYEVWKGEVRPSFIPQAEIARICAELIAKYGYEGAISRAAGEVSRAHYTCESFELESGGGCTGNCSGASKKFCATSPT